MASSTSSSASTPPWKYDVFLSFRGEDTRRSFTDYLHKELKRIGITTFIDDELERGEQISPALLQAIEDSRFSIIIFSQNYASSSWCLDELTKILECVDKGEHTAFPVFYEVDPSHVRKQRGSYEEAFRKHEEAHKNNMEKVVKWREALATASGYSGWDTRDSYQSEVIDKIVSKIFNEVVPGNPSSSNKIAMVSRMEVVLSLLCLESPKVRMVGIWGMAGIGKTTLAEAIYQRICSRFEGHCFLSNVREKSKRIENLQKELLSKILKEKNLDNKIFTLGANSIKKALHSKKVLIVLDDVNDINQLEELAGDCNWFGPKSRIIITTRDKRLLIVKDVDEIYRVEELMRDKALMLFCQHAFKDESPVKGFEELCDRSLDYTKGNPLAIKILGSLLYKRTKKEWDEELKKLKKYPNEDIQKVLRISFDGLEKTIQEIFLDIACFFKDKDKDHVLELLESCDLYPETGIPTLIERALITISYDNRLSMHDLIQEMGWEIVRQQSNGDSSKQSRLWLKEDVEDAFATNIGMETIQVIILDLPALGESLNFNVDVFTKMIKLRVLKLHDAWRYYFRGKGSSAPYEMHLRGDFKFLSNNLRYLKWNGYPWKSLPSNFNPRKLFKLKMRFSQLEQLWEGNKSFCNLKYMDLSHSQDLIRTPNLSEAPELKELNLEGCTSLVEVHPSIESLKRLRVLNLKNCSKLEELAKSFHKLTSLERLYVSGCSELRKLPDDLWMSSPYLDLSGCSKLQELPESIGKLTHLSSLDLTNCRELTELPVKMENLQSLVKMVADGSGVQEIPLLTRLEELSLARCNLSNLALPLSSLLPRQESLTALTLRVGALPSELNSLRWLGYLDLSGNSFITLPSLTPLVRLRWLSIEGCKSLRSLRKLPSSVETIWASNCESLETFSHPQISYALSDSETLEFDFSNCGRLLENEESSSVSLEAILDGIRFASVKKWWLEGRKFCAFVAGSRIPKWFIHGSSQGNSIIVHRLPPDFQALQSLRLAFCAVLGGNPSRWHSDHLLFGIVSAKNLQNSEYKTSLFTHLKFSFSGNEFTHSSLFRNEFTYDGRPLVVKECAIRLLYLPRCSPEKLNRFEMVEYETVNATSFSSPHKFEEESCRETTIIAKFGDSIYYGKYKLELGIEVKSYNLKKEEGFNLVIQQTSPTLSSDTKRARRRCHIN